MNKRSWGFGLAETIIALGILAVVFLIAAALLTSLLRGTQKESDLTAGTILAEQVLTTRVQAIFAGVDPDLTKEQLFASESPPSVPIQGTVRLNQSVYTYEITYASVTSPSGVAIGSSGPGNRLKKLDIVVWWWNERPEDTRAGYGFLRAETSRLVGETGFDS